MSGNHSSVRVVQKEVQLTVQQLRRRYSFNVDRSSTPSPAWQNDNRQVPCLILKLITKKVCGGYQVAMAPVEAQANLPQQENHATLQRKWQ